MYLRIQLTTSVYFQNCWQAARKALSLHHTSLLHKGLITTMSLLFCDICNNLAFDKFCTLVYCSNKTDNYFKQNLHFICTKDKPWGHLFYVSGRKTTSLLFSFSVSVLNCNDYFQLTISYSLNIPFWF